tara:strand:- start:1632 stop:2177 length:546 start_codon:yes stop_codon:yes gene_type:complete
MGGSALQGRDIKREEIELIVKKLNDLGFSSHCEKYDVCGSYRRKQPVSSDIDIVLLPKESYYDWIKNVDCEKRYGYFCDSLLIDGVQIDFFPANIHNYYCQVMMWTGSATFNTYIKSAFLDKGIFFSTYGIYVNEKLVTGIKSEKDIFNIIGHKYIPPEGREFGFKKVKKIIKSREPEWKT